MLTELIIRKDKECNWFRVFLPTGEEVSKLLKVKMVEDSFTEEDKDKRIIATFEAVVKIGDDI